MPFLWTHEPDVLTSRANTTTVDPADLCRRAADVIAQRGWSPCSSEDARGAVSVTRAIWLAVPGHRANQRCACWPSCGDRQRDACERVRRIVGTWRVVDWETKPTTTREAVITALRASADDPNF